MKINNDELGQPTAPGEVRLKYAEFGGFTENSGPLLGGELVGTSV